MIPSGISKKYCLEIPSIASDERYFAAVGLSVRIQIQRYEPFKAVRYQNKCS